MKALVSCLTILVAATLSAYTHACGDSLYRVGQGVSYRVYTAPLPGSVLVYGASESALQLAAGLTRSGHGVHVAKNPEELKAELDKGEYDVVIAPYSEHELIDSASRDAAKTSYLPVAMTSEEASIAKEKYDSVLISEKHELKHFLKAIHKSLKSHS